MTSASFRSRSGLVCFEELPRNAGDDDNSDVIRFPCVAASFEELPRNAGDDDC